MKQRTKYILILALLVFVLAISAGCGIKETDVQSNNTTVSSLKEGNEVTLFEPEFSSERMLDTIKLLSSKDNARITGFEGESAAADYLVDQFTSFGLEVSKQSFPIKAYVCDLLELKVTSDSNRVLSDAKALSYSAATPEGGITAEIVPLGMGAESDYVGQDVNGKIVLVQRGGEYFYIKTARAASKGAAAVLFYDPNSEGAISATLTQLSKIPAVSITRDVGQSFENATREGNTVTVSLNVDITYEDATSNNIIALYKSENNPDSKRIIVGAHYDGVDTPSANDNASGAAALVEMAKAISDGKVSLPYDVEFIAFGAEEIGLVGSHYYVDRLTKEDRDQIVAMLNFDMVGVGDSFDLGSAEGLVAPKLISIARDALKDMGYFPTTSMTDRSDHAPFAQAGIDAVYIQVGPFHDYHTDLDTFEMINPERLVEVCELGTELIVKRIPEKLFSE